MQRLRKSVGVTAVALFAFGATALTPVLQAQPVGLPSMGSASGAELSPALERTLGNAIMEQGRRDPTFISDPLVEQYLNDMGRRLAEHAPPSLNQEITVFALRDPSINAFAMPGGYVGIHSGLVVSSETEAELASVVAHEIGHVAQRHIARGMTQSSESSHIMLASLAGALLAALSGSPDLAMGVATFGQAAAVDRQLGFSRSAEHEADRTGFQMLKKAGYDPQGMVQMFRRLMSVSRLNEGSSANVYVSTHPLSVQRMSDIENRIAETTEQKGYYEDPNYWYVRAVLRIIQARSGQALVTATDTLQDEARRHTGTRQAAAWYGLAYAALQAKQYAEAENYLAQAATTQIPVPAISALQIRLLQAQQKFGQALALAETAWQQWPDDQGIALAYVQLMQQQQQGAETLDFLQARIKQWPEEPRFQKLLAENYERQGQQVAARRAMAQYYTMVGALPTAVEQLQQARNLTNDFYEQSQLDVQIRALRERLETERLLLERFRA